MTYHAITAESSTRFRASSSLQDAVKPSPTTSKLARGYRDFKIPRVRLTDYLILVRMISRGLVGRLSSIWVMCASEEDSPGWKKAITLSTITPKVLSSASDSAS
jgi:hypothetical protein